MNEAVVYVVDDDLGVLRSTCWLLESEGLTTKPCASAKRFLDAYDPEKPGCLVLDVRMPKMGGLDLQEWLVEQDRGLPIVFVTGYGDVPNCARAMKAGALDFLEKPVDDETLLAIVRQAVLKDLDKLRSDRERPKIRSRIETLTPREREVMQLLFDGKSVKQIASQLDITFQTVAKHRVRVFAKLHVENEAAMVRLLLNDTLKSD